MHHFHDACGGFRPWATIAHRSPGNPNEGERFMKIDRLADKLCAAASAAVVTTLFVIAPVADARDTLQKLSLDSALTKAQASGKLAPGIKLFFGAQKYPTP